MSVASGEEVNLYLKPEVERDITCLIVRAMMKHHPSGYSGRYPVRPGDCGEHCREDEQKTGT
jgi:hypothetical protein